MENKLVGSCIIGQSGGPTSVINASIYGAIKTALEAEKITHVYGAANGIKGVLNDKLYDMSLEDPNELALLKFTPSSALGSCRYKIKDPDIDDTDYKRIFEIFKKYDVRYFFYNGGNDSMDTCNKISKYMLKQGYACRVMGIPKTIDNDLFGTDHCPGFASAAKYIATTLMEVYQDAHVYDYGMVTIVEVMGRNAGWLTAASSLATYYGSGPDLIFLPEVPFDVDLFLEQVIDLYKTNGSALVAVSEGIHDKEGVYISEYNQSNTLKDSFGHHQMGGTASYLANLIKDKTGVKTRSIELSLPQRCAAHLASKTDYEEAFMVGCEAVKKAICGETDKMVGFECTRGEDGYQCSPKLFDLTSVANYEKKIPSEWILENGKGLTKDFIDYCLPLIQGETEMIKIDSLPRFAKLKKIVIKK